jgi:HEPN domain-containing protein
VPPDPRDEARRWLDQALEDLRAACRLAEDPTIPNRLAAFLAHLAAEKALKGALIARGTAVRRVHDLVALQAMLDPRDDAEINSDDIDSLTPWNIEGRYPVDPDQDTDAAARTVSASTRVVETLRRTVLGDRGDPVGP